jgi:hypothetical protein
MQEPPGGGTDPIDRVDAIDLAVEELALDGVKATVEDRVIRLINPVLGSPHLAVLETLGRAWAAGPVGAAAGGPAGVAAAVWNPPDLFIARWTGASRWVASYRFPARARPDAYLREESGIPSRLNRGNWYGEVPDEIVEAFFGVGLLLDEAPFPVPPPAVRSTPPAAPARRRSTPRTSAEPRTSAAPRAPAQPKAPRKKAAPRAVKVVDTTRSCPGCNLKKHPSQFIADSDLCVDCR